MQYKQKIGASAIVSLVGTAALVAAGLTMMTPSATASPLSLARAAVAEPTASPLLHEVVVVRRGVAVGPRGVAKRTTVVGPHGVARRTTVAGPRGVARRTTAIRR
jgi:hypothetical protein